MLKTIFLNLPVADVATSARFYEAIGLVRDPQLSGADATAMIWSDAVRVMLSSHAMYRTLTAKPIADPRAVSHVLFAIALHSRDAVDAITSAAVAAGGRELHGAEDLGFMYSRAFEDPDGHGFGPFHLTAQADATASPQAPAA